MNVQQYLHSCIAKMKEMQEIILNYLEINSEQTIDFANLIKFLDDHKVKENQHKLKDLLIIISKISNNYHRTDDLIFKIGQLLKYYKEEIKKNFENSEIFNIFKKNKRVLLILFEEKILIADQNIYSTFIKISYQKLSYPQYFYPEINEIIPIKIKPILKPKNYDDDPELFEKKRKIGENDSILAEFIRNDAIEKFVAYITKNSISLSERIAKSIFETNRFLLKNTPTSFIEYAAFYGSIQIFKYLLLNNVELQSSLWIYAIHSNNGEIIHLLEENKVKPPKECLIESIKCHHINMTNYIIDNVDIDEDEKDKQKSFEKSWNFHNFSGLENDRYMKQLNDIDYVFSLCCEYDYYEIVESFLNNYIDKFNVNNSRIKNHYIFNVILDKMYFIIFKICFQKYRFEMFFE